MCARPRVALVATGIANVASLRAAFTRLDCELDEVDAPEQVRDAAAVLLPGVGAFAAGIERLRAVELDLALAERVRAGAPTLAVCLGLQLLAEASDEAPGSAGLGLIQGRAQRFPSGVACPQLGWNAVRAEAGCTLLESGWMAFANSFRLVERPSGWRCAVADHGGEFVAAIERGAVLGCQFHPELSGTAGARLLGRWLERAGLGATTAGGVA